MLPSLIEPDDIVPLVEPDCMVPLVEPLVPEVEPVPVVPGVVWAKAAVEQIARAAARKLVVNFMAMWK